MEDEKKRPAEVDASDGPATEYDATRNEGESPASAKEKKQENSKALSDWDLLKKVPTLWAYIERVGAKPKSFRRYVIEGEAGGGYKKDIASVTIDASGTITAVGVEEPTEAEQKAIKIELPGAAWPKSEPAPLMSLPDLLKAEENPDNIFTFKSLDGRHILYIQHRVQPEGKPKYYVSWSYWNDGVWRPMEPDGLLPLFGLEKLKDHSTVFIHEGAKAARHCAWMTERKTKSATEAFNAHPWNKELDYAAHLGWAGGAPNPHRTDWGVLRREGISNIYVVADNDQPGKEAIKHISKRTLLPMTAVIFDDDFKERFDLADPWPDAKSNPPKPDWWRELGDGKRRYLGPSFHQMCIPATFATRAEMTGKEGRPRIVVRNEFAADWMLSTSPHLLVHRRYAHLMLDPEEFNHKMTPYSDAKDVASLLADMVSSQADGLAYRPHQLLPIGVATPKIINVDGRRMINTYRPPTIRPAENWGPKDVQPFVEYIEHLIPNPDDRKQLLRWCATLVSRPQVRMRYSVLLISETQGIGKTTLGDAILKPLVGPWNVSYPSEQQITDSEYNSWVAHKRLAIVSEIYSGERRKTYDRCKSMITDDTIEVNRKYMESYTIENKLQILASSNSISAIHLDETDRRFLVPGVAETRKPEEWWDDFYAYINGGGLPFIAALFEQLVNDPGFVVSTSEKSPTSHKKMEVISESRTAGAKLAYDLAYTILHSGFVRKVYENGQMVQKPLGNVVIRMDEVRAWVAEQRGIPLKDRYMETVLTLRRNLMAGGLSRPVPKELTDGSLEYRVTIGKSKVEVLANFQIEAGAYWTSTKDKADGLDKFHLKPEDFIAVDM